MSMCAASSRNAQRSTERLETMVETLVRSHWLPHSAHGRLWDTLGATAARCEGFRELPVIRSHRVMSLGTLFLNPANDILDLKYLFRALRHLFVSRVIFNRSCKIRIFPCNYLAFSSLCLTVDYHRRSILFTVYCFYAS
jgi:hypothetical protein